MLKNVATKLVVYCWTAADGLPKTGDAANLTAYVALDFDTTPDAIADTSATEFSSTNAKGFYMFDLAQGETNGDYNLYTCKSATAGVVCMCVPAFVHTLPTTGILAPTTASRTLDVSAGGEAGVDWANVGSQSTSVNLSATTVNLVNTVTTYTGNTPQTGDSFARIGATGSGLTSLAPAATALSTVQWTNARAGYLDNINNATIATAVFPTDPADQSLIIAATTSILADTNAIVIDTNELQTDWTNGGRLDLLLDAVVADNPNTPTKNVQLSNLVFTMVDATDFNTPETGITVTATISKDGGAFASCSNAVSEISGGFYKITLTNTEMNADAIALKFTGTGCAQRNFSFRTQPT